MLGGIVADEGLAVVRDEPKEPRDQCGDERRNSAHPLHRAPPQIRVCLTDNTVCVAREARRGAKRASEN